MSRRNGSTRRFKVIYTKAIQDKLRELIAQATAEERYSLVLETIQRVDRNIQERADEFGDFFSPLKKGTIRLAVIRPIVIYFAVIDESPIVFVTEVRLMSVSKE